MSLISRYVNWLHTRWPAGTVEKLPEVNADGIRVLSLYPGRTATPMQAAVHEMESREYRPERLMRPEDVASAAIHALKLPRSAEVTDLHLRPLLKTS